MAKVTTAKKTASAPAPKAPAKPVPKVPAYTAPENLIRFELRFRDGPNGPVNAVPYEAKGGLRKAWEGALGSSTLGNKYVQLSEILSSAKGGEIVGRKWTFSDGQLKSEGEDGRALDTASPTGEPMASVDEKGKKVNVPKAPKTPKAPAPAPTPTEPKGKAPKAPAAPAPKAPKAPSSDKPLGPVDTLDGMLGRFGVRVGTNRDALLRRLWKSVGKPVARDALLVAVYGEATPDGAGKLNMVLKGLMEIAATLKEYSIEKGSDKNGANWTLTVAGK